MINSCPWIKVGSVLEKDYATPGPKSFATGSKELKKDHFGL